MVDIGCDCDPLTLTKVTDSEEKQTVIDTGFFDDDLPIDVFKCDDCGAYRAWKEGEGPE